jgi:hypothetical protein
MDELYVCPVINGLDPGAKDFDGGGHSIQFGGVPSTCQEVGREDGPACGKQLVPASKAWRDFYSIADSEEVSQ